MASLGQREQFIESDLRKESNVNKDKNVSKNKDVSKNVSIVITTINPPTEQIHKWHKLSQSLGYNLIIIGDQKTPDWGSEFKDSFYSFDRQNSLPFKYIKSSVPANHYARKNVGYLMAIDMFNADIIYETDDDNEPMDNWHIEEFDDVELPAYSIKHDIGRTEFFNTLKTRDRIIWPRGFPLQRVKDEIDNIQKEPVQKVKIGVWQNMVFGEPDVDAIYRMVGEPLNGCIEKSCAPVYEPPYALKKWLYAPFNSQNTTWRKEMFGFLPLPSNVPSRACDIVRSYAAQRLMWNKGFCLGIGEPTVYQKRNKHDAFKDLKEEVAMIMSIEHGCEIINEM